MRFQGRVVEWHDERGFGYVVTHGEQQRIFLHIKHFSGNRGRRPQLGDVLTYVVTPGERGRPKADAVAFAATRQPSRPAALVAKSSRVRALCLTLFFVALAVLAWKQRMPWSVLAAYAVMSLVTFLAYADDKRAAKAGRWRTPENTLQLMALLCGWPGAWLAQGWLRHKSSKSAFLVVFWFAVGCNLVGVLWLAPRLLGMIP